MNKSAIQKYTIWARKELIEQVKQRAFQYGISETGFGDENASVVAGRVLSNDEKRQRKQFIEVIKRSTYQQTIEEVAYTWFNRFIALRYMEVNDYLPTHTRLFSDASGSFKPEILSSVLHIDLPGLDKSKVSEYLNSNQTQELYRYLLLTQCNALNELLPEMFERLGTYTEILLPNNILKPEGVIGRLVNDIPEEDFKDAVQIIGWMYQYYNTEPKQEVFDGLKKNIKITKEKIPAATQLFTPDWIVRYMVENSLGRLWLDSHPNSKLREGWKYYVDEAEQTPEVRERLRVLHTENIIKSPEDIKFIDPCMGSGHILVYAFEVFMQIYTSEGYSERDAAQLILEKNLFGLDIDRRAYQLSYFALMMKARQYNRRIFTKGIKPQVYQPAGFPDGEEYGSLININVLPPKPVEKTGQLSFDDTNYVLQLNTWNFMRLLSQKYDVVVTNPPYMGASGMSTKLSDFVKMNYPDSKSDLFAVFIEKCSELLKPTGHQAMITQHAWMFLSSYEKLRDKLLQHEIVNMVHLGARAFEEIGGEVVQTTSFVLSNRHTIDYKAVYYRLTEPNTQQGKENKFFKGDSRFIKSLNSFTSISGSPIAYWLSDLLIKAFVNSPKVRDFGDPKVGLQTGNNERYYREWYEVDNNKVSFKNSSKGKFVPCIKGGESRKWYGNQTTVIDWENNGASIKQEKGSVIRNPHYYYRSGLEWTKITSNFALRYFSDGFILTDASVFVFPEKDTMYVLSCLNSKVMPICIGAINPTLNFVATTVAALPICIPSDKTIKEKINASTLENIEISKKDWDAFELSWDFLVHPLVYSFNVVDASTTNNNHKITLKEAYEKWEKISANKFVQLKANEEELNRIFIEIYGLKDELTPEIEDKEITVSRADLKREIRSLISYAVGCMLGRYSLDAEGLVYAGGEWDVSRYQKFPVDKDNIIPILDDEYFEDDIVGRFVLFIKTVYGEDTLEENLRFVADTLGGKGTSREIIRNYFINDFYADHLKIYQKRPIYWMFDSGKRNGFKSLIYMHRYSRDLVAKLRTDYVHEQQERYRTQLSRISSELNHALGTERSKLLKQQDKLTEQLKEITAFEEKVHHLADQHIDIDLDDGVKKNYALFEDVLAKI